MGCNPFDIKYNVMKSNLTLSLKRKVYNQCLRTTITYGSETWSLTKTLERKLLSNQRGKERIIFGITWSDRKRTSGIREQTKVEGILTKKKKKVDMGWTCHAKKE